MKKYCIYIFVIVSTLFARSDNRITIEKLQSAVLFSSTTQVNWPMEDSKKYFIITLFNNSPILDELKKVSASRKVDNKQIRLNIVNDVSEIDLKTNLIFIDNNNLDKIERITKSFKLSSTLVVADVKSKKEKRTCINLITTEKNISYQLNMSNIKFKNLEVSQKLRELSLD